MSAFILDAGALVAVDRDDRWFIARLRVAVSERAVLRTNPLAIAQAWRHEGGHHARLSSLLKGTDVVPVDAAAGRAIGVLLGRSGTSDVVDASLVLLAQPGDTLVTSDPQDLGRLADVAGTSIAL